MKLASLVSLLIALTGCSTVPTQAPVVRPGQMATAGPDLTGSPFWIAFEPGDEVPVFIDVASPVLEARPAEPVIVKIKRRFFLLIGDGMPRISYDRRELVDGHGSFRFGITATKERGTSAEISVRHEDGD